MKRHLIDYLIGPCVCREERKTRGLKIASETKGFAKDAKPATQGRYSVLGSPIRMPLYLMCQVLQTLSPWR